MELSIASLQAAGAFTGAPAKRDITWEQGGKELTATVYVRPLSYKSALADLSAMNGKSDVASGRIAACIVDADGKPIFTPEDVTGDADPERGPLNANLTMALLGVIAEVSGLGKTSS